MSIDRRRTTLIVVMALSLATTVALVQITKQNNFVSKSAVSPEVTAKQHSSGLLKITFRYPASYQIREAYNEIILTNGERIIKITLAGSAGQTTDVDTYLNTLLTRNSQTIQNKQSVQSGTFTGYNVRFTESTENPALFYILSDGDGTVYTITGNTAELADDINTIISSFRRPAD